LRRDRLIIAGGFANYDAAGKVVYYHNDHNGDEVYGDNREIGANLTPPACGAGFGKMRGICHSWHKI
jgi:hypothetical protein